MERTIDKHEVSYAALFAKIGKGNKIHVNLQAYSKGTIYTECHRQNRYANCSSMNNKFATSTTERPGYITIIQRY